MDEDGVLKRKRKSVNRASENPMVLDGILKNINAKKGST